jgi:hypothetical protein
MRQNLREKANQMQSNNPHREIQESYRPIGDKEDCFDIEFWQAQGAEAIFQASQEMVMDYLIIRNGHADEPRLQRFVESYGKIF